MLSLWIEQAQLDFLILTETWLRETIPDSTVTLPGYSVLRKGTSSKGGGVAIYCKERFNVSVVALSCPEQYG